MGVRHTVESDSASASVNVEPHSRYNVDGTGGVTIDGPTSLSDDRDIVSIRWHVEDQPWPDIEDREPTDTTGFGCANVNRDQARELGEALIEASEAEPEPLFENSDA